jgi:hypothetical protein
MLTDEASLSEQCVARVSMGSRSLRATVLDTVARSDVSVLTELGLEATAHQGSEFHLKKTEYTCLLGGNVITQ